VDIHNTSVLEQKLQETGDFTYPDLRPLQNTGVSWKKDKLAVET